MMGDLNIFPRTYKDVFSLKEYTKWYHMLWVAPILLAMMLFWDCIVVPYRKLRKKMRKYG